MSIGLTKINNKKLYDDIFHDITHLIIPFSEFFKDKGAHLIYTGQEQIAFEEKDPEFIKIMIKEFL